ncbi:MAG: hypothetical protein WBG04_14735 [Haloferula sp.]
MSFKELSFSQLFYREGKKYLPLSVVANNRSAPVPLKGMNSLELFIEHVGSDDVRSYKLVGKSALPKGAELALFFIFERSSAGALPLTLKGIDDSMDVFPPGSFRFANFTKIPLKLRFGTTNGNIKPGGFTVVKSNVEAAGGFLPLWLTTSTGKKVYENRLWSQLSGRDMLFIGPPPRPGGTVSVMLLPQVVPPEPEGP